MRHRVVILAGGKGQRLRPYTEKKPKPLLDLGEYPIIHYVLKNVKNAGFKSVLITVGTMADQIIEYLENKYLGLSIEYSVEQSPEGTAGCLVKVKDKLDNNFLVLMADQFTTIDLNQVYNYHLEKNSIATIVLKQYPILLEYGVANIEDNNLVSFEEKPAIDKLINTGVYGFNKKILEYIKVGDDFAKDVFPNLLKSKISINYYISNEFWTDIGTVKEYENFRSIISIIEAYYKLR